MFYLYDLPLARPAQAKVQMLTTFICIVKSIPCNLVILSRLYIEYKVKKANSTQKLLWLVPILKLYLNWITALLLSCFARKTNVSTDFFFFTYYMYEFALQSVTQRITPAEMFLRLQNITFRTQNFYNSFRYQKKKSFMILAKSFYIIKLSLISLVYDLGIIEYIIR